jgi:hypothetical protein
MTASGQPCPEPALSPEYYRRVERQSRRVASLYQDKEVRNNVNTTEEDTFKDSVLEISEIYIMTGDGKRCSKPLGIH